MEKGIVDRFEDELVVIEVGRRTIDVQKDKVDPQVKVGDVVYLHGNKWRLNQGETNKRSTEIKKLMDDVWED